MCQLDCLHEWCSKVKFHLRQFYHAQDIPLDCLAPTSTLFVEPFLYVRLYASSLDLNIVVVATLSSNICLLCLLEAQADLLTVLLLPKLPRFVLSFYFCVHRANRLL